MEPLGTSMKGFVDVVTSVANLWSEWGLRITVIGSLAAYAVLGVLSGTRRQRTASSRPSMIIRWVVAPILWAAYLAGEQAAISFLGSLSLCGSDASAEEKLVMAFWAPFLLLHLGGPDNMAAYALEDTTLSLRKVVRMVLQFLGVIYAIWDYIYRGQSRFLFPAAVIMFVVGGARYVERACALRLANLDKMPEDEEEDSTKVVAEGDLDDGAALLLAQDLFPIWRRAMVDSSVRPRSAGHSSSETIFSLGWDSMCKVVEMELSLMYDTLYTKATVSNTWPGYLIRLVSPLATAAAALLFWLHGSSRHGWHRIRGSFVVITYVLLGAAFTMDVVWLLRALGSTWTYHFFKTKTGSWWRHQALCTGRWHRLHRTVVYLDPLRLLFRIDPVRYRRWSGTIGRYNLLHECTAASRRRSWRRWLATKLGLEEARYLSELPQGVKKLLFERVRRVLPVAAGGDEDDDDAYTMAAVTTLWGQEALRRGQALFGGHKEVPISGREFEQDVLAWHIATCIFLSRAKVRKLAKSSSSTAAHYVPAIEAVSEYLMFLVAKRRQLLLGLVLHKH